MFPFFASFIIFVIWLTYELKKHNRKDKKVLESFWERESRANATRRKPLDDLEYIQVPVGTLPLDCLPEDSYAAEYADVIRTLAPQKIVNFTGISNTDLKLRYGAPNIDLLSRYDQNYTVLVRTLEQLAEKYFESGLYTDAQTLLEYAVSIHSDVTGTYRLLKAIYLKNGQEEKLSALLDAADALHSITRPVIVRMLQESDSDTGLPHSS